MSLNYIGTVLGGLLASIEQSGFSEAVRTIPYLYPILMSVHVIGIALLVGPIISVDLRILGIGKNKISLAQALNYLLPICRLGFLIVFITGAAMFSAVAVSISSSTAAPIKFGLIILACINVIIFHISFARKSEKWDLGISAPLWAKSLSLVSMICWVGAIFGGRFLAY